jgi:hypothetical protein
LLIGVSFYIFGNRLWIKKTGFIGAVVFLIVTVCSNIFASEQKAELVDRTGYPGNDFRLGKGKPPVDPTMDVWGVYLNLWWSWASNNKPLIEELRIKVRSTNNTLCDIFASTPVNQAHALSIILYQTQEGVF